MTGKSAKIKSRVLLTALPPSRISDEQFLRGNAPIFSMAKSQYYENKLEAAKMLFDLGKHEEQYVSLEACRKECVASFVSLVSDPDFEDVRQHAIIACARLCEFQGYKVILMFLFIF